MLIATFCASALLTSTFSTAWAQPPEAPTQTGRVIVTEAEGRPIRVLVDGVDQGPAPLTLDLEPRSYEITGQGAGLTAAARRVVVTPGQTSEVVLHGTLTVGRLEVRTSDGRGTLFIDGEQVGEGSFEGALTTGEHTLRVERAGYETYEKTVHLTEGQVRVETVALRQQAEAVSDSGERGTRVRDGLYSGVQVGFALMPGGADSTLDTGCDSLGATTCESSRPWGAGVAAYVGYAMDPLGFELLLTGLGDVSKPRAAYDGEHGSSINPLVAKPAREEKFSIYRAGAAAAGRLRGNVDLPPLRLSAALGVGFAWRSMWLERDAVATDGTSASDLFAPSSVSYWTPGLSADIGGQVWIGEKSLLTFGAWMWAETAGEGARTEQDPSRLLSSHADGVAAQPIATPEYDLANGPQLYLGPYLGVQFGP